MASQKLTHRKVVNAKTGKYEDGNGLRLVVSKKLAKKWVFRYMLSGKRYELGLGSFPTISLEEARDNSIKMRKLLAQGKDPKAARIDSHEKKAPSFISVAAAYIRSQRHGWSNKKHKRQWVSTIRTYVCPTIGSKAIDIITDEEILNILKPIWIEKTETAKRVQGRLENIFDYAIAHKQRDIANPARWRGYLDKILICPSKIKKVVPQPAMPYNQVKNFMLKLINNNTVSSLALQFLILTAARTNEVIHSTWDEIDLENRVWTIPAERMKAKKIHQVPLSDQAIFILQSIPMMHDENNYIFYGKRHGKSLSNMALLQLMRRMGYSCDGELGYYVPHGFRSSFRDWSGEVSSFPRDIAEMALAHAIKNKAEAAYRRGAMLEKRRKMMQQWADYIL